MSKFFETFRVLRSDFAAFRALPKDERGVTALEYGLIAAVVATAVVGVGPQITTFMTAVFTRLTTKLGTT